MLYKIFATALLNPTLLSMAKEVHIIPSELDAVTVVPLGNGQPASGTAPGDGEDHKQGHSEGSISEQAKGNFA